MIKPKISVFTLLIFSLVLYEKVAALEENIAPDDGKNLPISLERLMSQLRKEGARSASFRQERWLSILEEPLISTGHFYIDPSSIKWAIDTPFALEYLFDGKALTIQEGDTKRSVVPQQDPSLYGFFIFILNAFNGEQDHLTEWFSLHISGDNKESVLSLKPIKRFLKRSLSSITVTYLDGEIQSVSVEENEGDKLKLIFSYTKAR